MITIGLCQIKVGEASPAGTMPGNMTKIGKTYQDSAKINQDKSEVTEHYEEGMAAPEVRKKRKKVPKIVFSIMNADITMLANYVGGTVVDGKWCFDGNEVVANKAILLESEQGLNFEVPNGDIEATINADMSAKGIFLVDFEVTPMAVAAGKALRAYPKSDLVVTPTSLTFTASADSTGKTLTVTSTGNLTYAAAPQSEDWITVTRSGKVATVKVAANPNSEARSTMVTLVADGKTVLVPVTQAGA